MCSYVVKTGTTECLTCRNKQENAKIKHGNCPACMQKNIYNKIKYKGKQQS